MRIKNRSQAPTEEASINLTPLIDVVFVMLIMFIIVAPLLEMDSVELASSGPASKEVSSTALDASPISIHVRKDNTILFNRTKVTAAELGLKLQEAKKRYPKAVPLLLHDKKAQFGTYQSVKNAAEEAGYRELNIVLAP